MKQRLKKPLTLKEGWCMPNYTFTPEENAALTRCLAEQQAADPDNAPKNVDELFRALAKDRLASVVKHYADQDTEADTEAILAAFKADPAAVRAKLSTEIAAARNRG